MIVDFPEPLCPTKATYYPFYILRERFSNIYIYEDG